MSEHKKGVDANYLDDTRILFSILENLKTVMIMEKLTPQLLDGILGTGSLRKDIVKEAVNKIPPPLLYSHLSYPFLGEEGIERLTRDITEEEIEIFLSKLPQRAIPDLRRIYKKYPRYFAILKLSLIFARRHLERGYIVEIEKNGEKDLKFTEKGLMRAIIDFYCFSIYYKVKMLMKEGYVLIITREPETVFQSLLDYLKGEAPKTLENAIMGYRMGNKLEYVLLKKTEELRNALGIPPEKFQQVVTLVIPSIDNSINTGFLGCPTEENREEYIDGTAKLLSNTIRFRILRELSRKEKGGRSR
jgi:hypothetical protein